MHLNSGLIIILTIPALLVYILLTLRPNVGLMVLVFVIYTNLSDILISKFGLPSLAQPLITLLIVVILTRTLVFQDRSQGWITPFILMGAYTLLGSLALFYASDVGQAIASLLVYLKDVIIGLVVIFYIQNAKSLRLAVWALLAAGILMGTISVFQVFTGTYSKLYAGFGQVANLSASDFRLAGVLNDPNFYAQIMVVLVPIALERFLDEKPAILRFLAGWALIVCTVTILYTYSRGSFIALGIVALLVILQQRRRPLAPVLLLLTLGFILFQFLPQQYTQRISTLLQVLPGANNSATLDASIQARSLTDIVGWTMFTDNPIFGVGIGNFNSRYLQYALQLGVGQNVETQSAHNLYLQVAAERGIVGFLSFVAILYFSFTTLAQARSLFLKQNLTEFANLSTALGIGLIGYLVAALFLHDAYIRYLWLLVGIAASFLPVARNSKSESKSDVEYHRMLFKPWLSQPFEANDAHSTND
ncbi:MAG: O-antigen ligase family protein [Anaerolineales bacterium]